MITTIKGVITSIFPDDINTDDIIPAWTLQESTDKSYFGKFAFGNFDPHFVKRCKKNENNIIIAGKNFGCGSSREQAIYALQFNNVSAIIAQSFPDIFYRNAINNGLALLTVDNIGSFRLNKKLKIDLENKIILYEDNPINFEISDEDAKSFILGGRIGKVRKHLEDLLGSKSISSRLNRRTKIGKFPQTIVEKIISDHLKESAYAGDKIDYLPIDVLFFNEVIGPPAISDFNTNFNDIFQKNKYKNRVFDPEKIYFIPDHTVPSSSVSVSEGITLMEEFAKNQNIKCFKEGDGIEHVVLIEEGIIIPGEIILGTDSHTDTNGALNTLAFGCGTTDASYALATGHLYDFEVPRTIRINMRGIFDKGVYAKDLILYLIGTLGVDGASRKIVEFGGIALSHLSMDSRTTIANMAVEMGARTAIFEADKVLKSYIRKRAKFKYKTYIPDSGCKYEKIIEINLSKLSPMVAFPHKPSNVASVTDLKNMVTKSQHSNSSNFAPIQSLKITDAFLGACTNGKYEDFVEAAKILKGKKVHKDVNFIAIPASRTIYNRLLRDGVLQIFAEAGANIESSNCGPCFGKHMGVIGKGAQMISSSNRNYIGRMGSKDAKIFLASPVTVAAAAVAGKIVDPRIYL